MNPTKMLFKVRWEREGGSKQGEFYFAADSFQAGLKAAERVFGEAVVSLELVGEVSVE